MDGIRFVDIYATKGLEYLIVLAFLGAFVVFCRYVKPRAAAPARAPADDATRFRVPDGIHFHPGHGWFRSVDSGTGVVGLDDFARKLVGRIDGVDLPPVGTRLAQGGKGWSVVVDEASIPMLSPVGGEVVEVNPEVARRPEILRDDPYGKGWLLRVRSPRAAAETRSLLSGKAARAWMESAIERLQPPGPELGHVLQDGGLPVEGLARVLGGDHWQELARTHLLTEET